MDNKVVQTLARAFVALGWRSVRFNFRGVGASQGAWDDGVGEIDDALAVIKAFADPSFMLAGFSFGAYVAAQAATRDARGRPAAAHGARRPVDRAAAGRRRPRRQPRDPRRDRRRRAARATLAWARPQSLPVIVFPGVGHFFHGQLGLLKSVVVQELTPRMPL